MKVAFLFGPWSIGSRPINAFGDNLNVSSRGLTGSELGIFRTAAEFVKLGHDVSLFTVFVPDTKPEQVDGIKLFDWEESSKIDDKYDAIISWSEPDVFRALPSKPLRVVCEMLNDWTFCHPNFHQYVDVWTAPSDMLKEHLIKQLPSEANKNNWYTVPLGCDPDQYETNKKVSGRIVSISSPDRGLIYALQQFPYIKQAVPNAEFHIYYHMDESCLDEYQPNDNKYCYNSLAQAHQLRYLKYAIKKLEPLGVRYLGASSRKQVAQALSEAEVAICPLKTLAFSEGFSVATLETMAASCLSVVGDIDCLGSVYGNVAPMVPAPIEDHLQEFTDLVIRGLTDDKWRQEVTTRCRNFARSLTWENSARKLEKILKAHPKCNRPKNDFPSAEVSSSVDSWVIPNNFNLLGFPLNMTDEQLQAVVIMVWKEFMLHDEILSAISFLEQAPYRVRHSAITEKALQLTKKTIAWLDDAEEFQTNNAPANPEFEAGTPLPRPLIWQEGNRYDLIADNLAPNSKIVDFGCMDGCFCNRFGMAGHSVVGLDVCESSIKLARKKAEEFKTNAQYVCTYFEDAAEKVPNNYFDCATSSDTYEHLRDPVNEMLLPAKKMLHENGKFLLVTPHGSWLRGQYCDWAHPWVLAKEGKLWLEPYSRAHLIAPTIWTVVGHFRRAGYYVKNCYVKLSSPQRDVEGQGNIFAEAYCRFPDNYTGRSIAVVIQDEAEKIYLLDKAKELSKAGNQVTVYADEQEERIYDGIEYKQFEKFKTAQYDVLFEEMVE